MSNHISSYLQQSRKDLLDLGLRNPLINFKTRKNKIEIIDEISENVFDILVKKSKVMKFIPLPVETVEEREELLESLRESSSDWSQWFAKSEQEGDGKIDRHTDTNLQTNLTPLELHARLLSLHTGAQTYIEEQGVNVLYLALGFLHWYEDSGKQLRKAPLVLLPVEMKRSDAREKFSISYNLADLGSNLSLIEKLSTEFGIKIPVIEDMEDFDLRNYFDTVRRAIVNRPNWSINVDEIVLSFFSFGKFVMYSDLDENTWPEGKKPSEHRIISGLLDSNSNLACSLTKPDEDIDRIVSTTNLLQVIDSDSSQTLAQLDVSKGHSLVIQGPPGTGKSQTITNIIADAVHNGKKVLFVAEKMAALEVVKRRLDAIGLGDAVLELHSHKANKKSVLNEIVRTLGADQPDFQVNDQISSGIKYAQRRLNNFVKSVNSPVFNSKVTPVEAIGKLASIRSKTRIDRIIDASHLLHFSDDEYEVKKMIIEEVMSKLKYVGNPHKNVFSGCELSSCLPSKYDSNKGLLSEALKQLESLLCEFTRIHSFAISEPKTLHETQSLLGAYKTLQQKPEPADNKVVWSVWLHRERVHSYLNLFYELESLKNELDKVVDISLEITDIDKLIAIEKEFGGKWWKLLSSEYRNAKGRLNEFILKGVKHNNHERIKILENIRNFQNLQKKLTVESGNIESLLGKSSQVYSQKPDCLNEIIQWVEILQSESVSREILKNLNEIIQSQTQYLDIEKSLKIIESVFNSFISTLNLISVEFQCPGLQIDFEGVVEQKFFFETLHVKLENWYNNFSELEKIVAYNVQLNKLRKEGMGFLEPIISNWDEAGEKLVACFEYSRYQGLLEFAYQNFDELQEFDKYSYEKLLEAYQQLDRQELINNRLKVALKHWEGVPRAYGDLGQGGVLKREINKKRRHLPIRKLMAEAGDLIKQIKPVFMMGPMSIASFLPPVMSEFDLVIFDEASQVKPVDAFGAILRGKQVIVIGDSKQLPPTSFFESMSAEIEDEAVDTPISSDTESILGLFLSRNASEHMLKWHYRSKHESLIAISNKEFYNNQLIVFPSPGSGEKDGGLSSVHCPDTHYDRGKTRANIGEARVVALAIFDHIKKHPEQTLGVAAFSSTQRDAIMFELEAMRYSQRQHEFFFNKHPNEPFFIKNLENVQGDERDVILISIGYGKTKEGGPLNMNFGPLNKDGGERRLNVLISRARRSCKVFANFTSNEMDLERTASKGVSALKSFLQYAETGNLDLVASRKRASSIFPEYIAGRLRDSGYQVEEEIGISDYRIDIGVRDKNNPARFILGIESDGRNFAVARSLRDRIRLRKEVLEGLGWNLKRIWSVEWFRSEEREFQELIKEIHSIESEMPARHENKIPEEFIKEKFSEQLSSPVENQEPQKVLLYSRKPSTLKYQKYSKRISLPDQQMHLINPNLFLNHIKDIVEFEGPIHEQLLMKRITNCAGLMKVGGRIQENLETAIQIAIRQGVIVSEGHFLYINEFPIKVRDRSREDTSLKRVELIPPMELKCAFNEVIKDSISVSEDELIAGGYHLLGFQKITSQMRELALEIIKDAMKNGSYRLDSLKRITQ